MNFRTSVAVIEVGPTRVEAASEFGVSVEEVQQGEHIVTFPAHVAVVGCIATQNNGSGTITAIPGSKSELRSSQVRVYTRGLNHTLVNLTYTLIAFYPG